MLDCWLDESRGFCRDKVPIPKLKTVHQWIKRWQWSPKGMGSIACLFAVAGQSSTRHHSTFYPHFTCLYIRYDILVWFLSTLLDWKTHRNNPISHISLLFLPSLDHLCLLQCYGCCMFDRMGWWKRGGQSCQTSWELPINSHCILLLPTWNYASEHDRVKLCRVLEAEEMQCRKTECSDENWKNDAIRLGLTRCILLTLPCFQRSQSTGRSQQ